MDTRIGHDPPNEALHARQTAQHVRGPFVFRSAARLQHVKFTHHDKQQVKSERNLGNLAQPKPFVSTAFEGGSSASSLGMRALHLIAREGGRTIYITYLGETRFPVSILFLNRNESGGVELRRSRIVAFVHERTAHHMGR
jgi:hypothetical protein